MNGSAPGCGESERRRRSGPITRRDSRSEGCGLCSAKQYITVLGQRAGLGSTGHCGDLRILRDLVLIENPFFILKVIKKYERIRRNRKIAQKTMVSHS